MTPAQLSAECGFMDCSRYLESAASSQEQSDCLGVYEDQKRLESNTTASASPHDITANRVEPCVANFGTSFRFEYVSPCSHEAFKSISKVLYTIEKGVGFMR